MKEKIRALYAEDNVSDLDLTRTHFQLNAPDFELDLVNTGLTCLRKLQEGKYDVLLLDNRLPDMDGIEILRELSAKDVRMPVVMVTSVGDEALVIQVLRLGAFDYVPKQGNYVETLPAVLRNAVAEYRTQQGSGQGAGRRQRRILYVEHHQADIDLTLEHFADSAPQFILEVLYSPNQALARLQENNFDLVLVDLRMPEMTALDLLKEAKHRSLQVPFIIITGQGDEAAAVAALKLGAFDYIIKKDDYLTHLPHAIENAIARSQLIQTNRRLETELAERERAEADNARLLVERLNQRQRLDEIIASVPGLVWEAWGRPDDADQKMDFVSNHVESMLGYSVQQWLSTPNFWLSIVHPDDKERAAREAAQCFTSGKGGISQFRWIAQDERVVWVEAHSTVICDEKGNPLGMRGVTIDITASKEAERGRAQLEEQLRQAQKIDSIGRLAGGVAHDFNNILTAIKGYAELMLLELTPGDPLRSSVTEIRRAGERAADLTHQLLAFSRRQLLQPTVLALNSLIADNMKMLKRLLGEDIELVTLLDSELGQVKADSGQMDQVILNLALNARDAMPLGGRLTLETRNVILHEEYVQRHFSLQPGSYVMLAISDIGCGMDEETLSHIFEPFFTTKEPGKGTGLGLSTVYGIVQQSGGSICVYSEPGRGTTFKIYLPRIVDSVAEPEEKRSEPEGPRGSETILVVEDDEIVLRLTCQALRRYGYLVIEAANGDEALLACERHVGTISLIITDVVMPQISGPELAAKLHPLHPETQVLYMSGYTEDAVVRHGFLGSALFFLQKPFSPSLLVNKVRDILDQQSVRPAS